MKTEATKTFSSKQEHLIADSLDWKVVAGSGAAPCTPGDVISDEWLGECKTHVDKHKIFFDIKVWDKINNEAVVKHRNPVLFVDDGSQTLRGTWALCNRHNLNLSSCLVTGYPSTIRKNISFDGDKMKSHLQKCMNGNSGGFFDSIMFAAKWEKYDVVFMPFETFKEIYLR